MICLMLATQDLLNITLSIGFLIFVAFASLALYNLTLTLRSIKIVTDEVGKAARDVSIFKNEVKISSLNLIRSLLGGRR
jgi:hypothetical protein